MLLPKFQAPALLGPPLSHITAAFAIAAVRANPINTPIRFLINFSPSIKLPQGPLKARPNFMALPFPIDQAPR
jgi:hypothetical protein